MSIELHQQNQAAWDLTAQHKYAADVEHDVAFILDEVQANFGRTGKMYAYEKYGLEPDMVVELDPGLFRIGRDTQLEAALGYVREEMAVRSRGGAPAR